MSQSTSIGGYLIARLHDHGVRHVFGIPGDYVLGFYEQLSQSPLRLINTCDEQGAGFAADAYARLRGLGVVCVTYFDRLNLFLRENTIVIADVGDAMFGAADLFIHRGTEFLAPAYYDRSPALHRLTERMARNI